MSDVDNSAALANTDVPVATTQEVVEQPVPTPGPGDTPAGEQEAQPKPEEAERKRDRSAEKRISRLTQKYEESLREIGRLKGLEEARATTAKPADASDGKPHESQFKTYGEYQEALTDWKVDQKLAARDREAGQRNQQQTAHQAEAQRAQTVVEKIRSAGKDIDGFDEVMETLLSDEVTISATMRDFLGETDHPAQLAQWLAENPKEAARIAALDPAVAVKALEREEAKVIAKPVPRQTRTPAPGPTVSGRGSPQVDLSKITNMDEWAKVRGYS